MQLIFFISFVVVVLLLVINISVRLLGRVMRPRFPPQGSVRILFEERWRSGRSGQSRLGQAKNCLKVTVTNEELWIVPHFPFSILARDLDLEHRIKKPDVVAVENAGNDITITYDMGGGRKGEIDLRLRQPDLFMSAMGSPAENGANG